MKKYCLGFIFDQYKKRVVLIEKTRPEWQTGKMNGVGGYVEEDETPIAAMAREAYEEANLRTFESDWIFIGSMINNDREVNVFTAIVNRNKFNFPIHIDEGRVDDYPINSLPKNVLGNLHWLIPLTLDYLSFSPETDEYQIDQFLVRFK